MKSEVGPMKNIDEIYKILARLIKKNWDYKPNCQYQESKKDITTDPTNMARLIKGILSKPL